MSIRKRNTAAWSFNQSGDNPGCLRATLAMAVFKSVESLEIESMSTDPRSDGRTAMAAPPTRTDSVFLMDINTS